MPTLVDEKNSYAPCPWCGQPGRLMSRDYYTYKAVRYFKHAIGCINKACPVKPRTGWFSALTCGNKEAIQKSIERWERRNENTNN